MLTPGSGYLEALTAKNSICVFDPIDRISKSGIVTKDGREHKLEAIICTTGFDVSFRPVFPIIRCHNKDLCDFWKDTPTHYLSVAVPGFLNYFIIGGPDTPISNGSLIYGLEAAIDYAFSCIKKLQEEIIASLTVKIESTKEFLEHRDALMQRMVWNGNYRSWYTNDKMDGPVIGPWCGSKMHYREALNVPRWEDYHIRYMGRNRFTYLGMGRTRTELGHGSMASILTEPGLEE